MLELIYNIGIKLYHFYIQFASLFNPKAKLWVAGRKSWQTRYAQDWQQINSKNAPIVWVHCASLGEFEQGRPVIEALKKENPAVKIILTFFSPSGYEIRKNYPSADYICYLPIDSKANARIFIELFQPTLAIFVKYEFWTHYLYTLERQGIPILLISAIFREHQLFFKSYGKLFRDLLPRFWHIFLQNQASAALLESLNLHNFSVAGDTRIDRVAQIAIEAPTFPIVDSFAKNACILVAGSTWPPDEAILLPFINENLPADWKLIIAPHQINEQHLQQIEQGLEKEIIRYSQATTEIAEKVKVLLIDNIGMLSALYRYGRIAYIGGGFGAGIHNTLEPIAFGLPVIFGPKYQKFEEAMQLTKRGGAFAIENTEAFKMIFESLQQSNFYEKTASTARQYITENRGTSAKILDFIKEHKLL
ncbi:MAG: glycosyltransferase N-terminal domain-containing protein [Saprospiraceae bacterium]|nr:glycosyltransferase N-terminal domain-containing protein [Saprospiraceae bacterium]